MVRGDEDAENDVIDGVAMGTVIGGRMHYVGIVVTGGDAQIPSSLQLYPWPPSQTLLFTHPRIFRCLPGDT